MRTIKFRAWDEYGQTMLYKTSQLEAWFEMAQFKVMQYTGLKDKNGKEIYEGDIVKYICGTDNGRIMDVKYPDCFDSEADGSLYISKDWEVVGNVYENPELLK